MAALGCSHTALGRPRLVSGNMHFPKHLRWLWCPWTLTNLGPVLFPLVWKATLPLFLWSSFWGWVPETLEAMEKTRDFFLASAQDLFGVKPMSLQLYTPFHPSDNSPEVCVHAHTHSVMPNSVQPHGLQPTRLLCPENFPGKNTEVGCHFLLQRIIPTQGSNPCLLHWQADFFTSVPPGGGSFPGEV